MNIEYTTLKAAGFVVAFILVYGALFVVDYFYGRSYDEKKESS